MRERALATPRRGYYVGLACSVHDPALAIVGPDGEVLFAEASERYSQVKRAWNQPPDEINRIDRLLAEYCPEDLDFVLARTWSRGMPGRLRRRRQTLGAGLKAAAWLRVLPPPFVKSMTALLDHGYTGMAHSIAQAGLQIRARLSEVSTGRTGRISTASFDHHLSHAAFACFTSPFERALCAVVDGEGERLRLRPGVRAATSYRYERGRLRQLSTSAGSLGEYYFVLCMACGFDPYKGEEWKVMGLAPYGRPDPEYEDLLRGFVRVDGPRIVKARDWNVRVMRLLALRPPAGEPPERAADLACTGQQVFGDVLAEYLTNLHAVAPSDNLVLTGGCALNSSFNGKVLQRTPFKRLHVPPAPGDDGNAVGAALLAYYRDHPEEEPRPARHTAYLGSQLSSAVLERFDRFSKLGVRAPDLESLARAAARLLAMGYFVGWVQGRAEFGPRALGNRSILADPRSERVKDELNDRIKFREPFRPFAPAILHEHGPEYFEDYSESPYMERTLRFKAQAIDKVPGVVHVDRTGRLQTVTREWNERFHRLLTEFHEITGVPVLLNTSFNVMSRPIVHGIEDALGVFFTSGLDVLVVGNRIIAKDNVRWEGADLLGLGPRPVAYRGPPGLLAPPPGGADRAAVAAPGPGPDSD